MDIIWEKSAEDLFNKLIEKTPVFVREMAKEKISKRIGLIVAKENRKEIVEKDVVDAFFLETPSGFHGPLKSDMEALGVDYKKHGHKDIKMFWRPKKQ